MIRLMIKTHSITGMKYLCKTTRSDWGKYKGSGTRWRHHLNKHGNHFTTELLFETEDPNEFKKAAIDWSIKLRVVEDEGWANLCLEEGTGGATAVGRKWVTDGRIDKLIYKDEPIPNGWKAGRSKCVFNDGNRQKELASRVDIQKRGAAISGAWDKRESNGLGKRVTGLTGDSNPAKRLDVRRKMSLSAYASAATNNWTCAACGVILKRRGRHGTSFPCSRPRLER